MYQLGGRNHCTVAPASLKRSTSSRSIFAALPTASSRMLICTPAQARSTRASPIAAIVLPPAQYMYVEKSMVACADLMLCTIAGKI